MYDGTVVNATVYTKCPKLLTGQENNPPFQRYLDIMIEGARYFDVHPKQIDFLNSQSCRPRPMPHEFKSYQEPDIDAPLLSYDNDVVPFDGESSSLLRLAVNGKVIEINVDEVKAPVFRNFMNLFKQYGQRLELVFSKVSERD